MIGGGKKNMNTESHYYSHTIPKVKWHILAKWCGLNK